jgi:hypothetical protein
MLAGPGGGKEGNSWEPGSLVENTCCAPATFSWRKEASRALAASSLASTPVPEPLGSFQTRYPPPPGFRWQRDL